MRSPAVQFVFIVLAALSAFTLGPARSGVRDAIGALFLPVSYPVRKLALSIGDRVSPAVEIDTLSPNAPRSAEAIRQQNTLLLGRLSMLQAELEDTRQQLAHVQTLSKPLRERVKSAAVLGGPTAARQTLTINAAGHVLREGMPVIDPKGYVGQIYSVAVGGATARVLLSTDPASHVSVVFQRAVVGEEGKVTLAEVPFESTGMVDGTGRGLSVPQLTAKQIKTAGLAAGDVAVLVDPAFSMLRGMRVGTVSKITLPSTYDGFVNIELAPVTDLATLRDVLVVEK